MSLRTLSVVRGWRTHLGCAFVTLFCCLPLFGGLNGWDLQNDEAIYSYAVDRMLEGAGWITPRASPADGPFLEKPPLKFWMVASPIKLGLLPHDEFGLRFVDVLLGSVTLLYTYYFGVWLAGPVCGGVAVLVLFLFPPLLFQHGVRSNNMEAALLLSQTAGLYHFAAWVERPEGRRAHGHAVAVAAYFTLGFMTKFVAALFLPFVGLAALLWRRGAWSTIRTGWRDWIVPAIVAVVAIAPWFVYQTFQFGIQLWEVMLGEHVYTRFTGALDPTHLEPWSFYFAKTWQHLMRAGTVWLVAAGLVALAVAALRNRAWLPRLILIWGLLPPFLLSFGTSKLYHYIYPFVPALALAAGYAAARWTSLLVSAAAPRLASLLPVSARPRGWRHASVLRRALAAAAIGLFVLSALSFLLGTVHVDLGGASIFRNSSVARPLAIGALLLWAAGYGRAAAGAFAVVPLVLVLPSPSYRETIRMTRDVAHTLRAVRDCGVALRRSGAAVGPGFYNADSEKVYHSYFYYLRHLGPWKDARDPDRGELMRRLDTPGAQTPVLVSQADYNIWLGGGTARWMPGHAERARTSVAAVAAGDGIVVLLPGAYQSCVRPAVRAGAQQATFREGAS